MNLERIFISHRHDDASVAQALEKLFRGIFTGVKVASSSSQDPKAGPRAGQAWREWIALAVDADESVFVVRRRPSPWMLWEAGAVAAHAKRESRRSRGVPILFGVSTDVLPEPLDAQQAIDGADVAGIRKLLSTWMDEYDGFAKLNQNQRDLLIQGPLKSYLEELAPLTQPRVAEMEGCLDALQEDLAGAAQSANTTFADAIGLFAGTVASTARKAFQSSALEIPASRYPKYLLKLQSDKTRIVRAIALVEEVEQFWRDRLGVRVANEANPNSQRIFIFREQDRLKDYLDVLKRHAEKYRVRALQHRALTAAFPAYAYDFSVIRDDTRGGHGLVAKYAVRDSETGEGREIAFEASPEAVLEYDRAFDEMWRIAKDVSPDATADGLAQEVFGPVRPRLRPMPRRTVEMSDYIDIRAYDHHEEDHAYYREMASQMVDIMKAAMPEAGARVLEMGAGTGIFTRRLADLERVNELHALELDWECFQRLRRRFQHGAKPRLGLHFEDSRVYNPEGSFDFVVSSFSDHHISDEDKSAYLLNVRNNLKRDGLFVVGDEFLREPRLTDSKLELREALEAYHRHIIDIAKKEDHPEVAALEEAALRSGLERRGDFKAARSTYRRAVIAAGFEIVQELRIGPPESGVDIGGVFVFVMRCRREQDS